MGNKPYEIAVVKGDGVGPEVVDQSLIVLETLAADGGPTFAFEPFPCGAECFLVHGDPLPEATLNGCRKADAVLLGAMGLPHIRWPDGTEMRPQVDLRFKLDLYAGVRPIYLFAVEHTPLKGVGPGEIDLVILRENVEGLFASMNAGIELHGEVAIDSMVITRTGTERVVRFAFELACERARERERRAREREEEEGSERMRVTCVDKANIFRSMAFFRAIFDEVAEGYPVVARDHAYVDAVALYLVQRPQAFDVLVTENMYGDILSDMAAGLVGGMGMAPSADIGPDAAVFQPSHGTAPDIAGKGIANPVAMILSAGMMLDWLGQRFQDETAATGGRRIRSAVRRVLEDPANATPDLGGNMTTTQLGNAIAAAL